MIQFQSAQIAAAVDMDGFEFEIAEADAVFPELFSHIGEPS